MRKSKVYKVKDLPRVFREWQLVLKQSGLMVCSLLAGRWSLSSAADLMSFPENLWDWHPSRHGLGNPECVR